MSAKRLLEQTIAQFKQEYGKSWQQEFLESIRNSGSAGMQLRMTMTIALNGNSELAEQLNQPSDRLPLEILQAQAVDRFMENFDPTNVDFHRLSI